MAKQCLDIEGETWKDIEGYENLYQVSNTGRVRSIKNNKVYVLKQYTTIYGYMKTILWKNNKMKNFPTHRLVAKAFIPNPNNYPIINHKDENKTNNCVDNLEWCTPKYNSNYGKSRERCSMNNGSNKPVFQVDFDGNIIEEFYNISSASKKTGINQNLIAQCCRGEKIRGGDFLWCYTDNTDVIKELIKKRTGVYFKIKDIGYVRIGEIAKMIGVSRSTLYTSLYRGSIENLFKKYGLCLDNV